MTYKESIITLQDVKEYTSYCQFHNNEKYIELLISVTNIILWNMITEKPNNLHKFLALQILTYLINFNNDNIFEFIRGWAV